MALAAATHHSAQPRAKEEVEGEQSDAPRRQKPPPTGTRPEQLVELPGPQLGSECEGCPRWVKAPFTTVQFLLRCTWAGRERKRQEDADDELFSQRCSLFSMLADKWVLGGICNAKLFHNRFTCLSRLQFFFEDNSQSVSSDIMDVDLAAVASLVGWWIPLTFSSP